MNKSKITVSLGQMDIQLGQVEQNLARVSELAAEANKNKADVLVLPELWSTGYDLANAKEHADPIDQGIFAKTADLARQYNLSIVGSCLSLQSENAYGNTAVFFDNHGLLLAAYSKIHLFPLMLEDRYLAPGNEIVHAETNQGATGLAICYDLRFPEIFRILALRDCKIVFLPSEWPKPRLSHWQTLLRARAIENQMYVVACNRVGTSANYDFFGHSTIVDPWGETIIEGDDQEALLTAEIDLSVVDTARRKIPVFNDRRPDIY
jgi:omega-amidase